MEVTYQNFFNISLKCLSIPTLRIISTLLNPTKYIPTKQNIPRDWRGLADLTGCNSEEVSLFSGSPDPCFSVLRRWCVEDNSIVARFLSFLDKLDRFDVYDDVITLVIADINNYKVAARQNVDTSPFLTLKDRELQKRGLPPKQYHASILYADEDAQFAIEIVTKLEQDYKLDIFLKERDLIGGTIEHDATMKIIASQSNRLIVILSPAFLQSSENKYFLSFAQSIGIEQRQRKIVPCVYKECEIPVELKLLHKLNYNRQNAFCNFFDKLHASIIPASEIKPSSVEINIEKSTLTIPQLQSSKSLKEHSSMPELSEKLKEVNKIVEQKQEEHHSSTISLSSLTISGSQSKNKLSKIKKIFKRKPKVVAAS